MTGMEIVRQELKRIARGVVPLSLVAFGGMTLLGWGGVRTAVSLALGTAYSLLLFWMIGKSAAKAVHFNEVQGARLVRRGYAFRYVLTGVLVFLAIRLPYINPFAAVLPLFFPKIVLLCSSVFYRKGG